MIRFEVEIGHLLDVKQKEGHIWSSGELFDSLDQAEMEFNRRSLNISSSVEYVSLNRIEFDGDDIVQCDVLQTSYYKDLMQDVERN